MNTPPSISSKLREARHLLGLSQMQMAQGGGIYQADVSELERLEKTHIPVTLLSFLYLKGIDMHSLFGDGAVRLRPASTTQSMVAEPLPEYGPLAAIKTYIDSEVDRRIKETQRQLSKLDIPKLDKTTRDLRKVDAGPAHGASEVKKSEEPPQQAGK